LINRINFVVFLALLGGCGGESELSVVSNYNPPATWEQSKKGAIDPNGPNAEILGIWKSHGGFMGWTLVLYEGGYDYWFYSDVVLPNSPKYPISGLWKRTGDLIRFSGFVVHGNPWHIIKHNGKTCMVPDNAFNKKGKDGKLHLGWIISKVSP